MFTYVCHLTDYYELILCVRQMQLAAAAECTTIAQSENRSLGPGKSQLSGRSYGAMKICQITEKSLPQWLGATHEAAYTAGLCDIHQMQRDASLVGLGLTCLFSDSGTR